MNRRDFFASTAVTGLGLNLGAAEPKPIEKKARLRTAICAYSFRKELAAKQMTYQDLVRLAVELDVDGLDLTVYWFPENLDGFLMPLKRLAFRNAVEICSISIRTNCCQPTPEKQAEEVAGIRKWVDVAEKLGAGHIRVFGGSVPKGSTEDQAAGWVVEILKRASEYSASKGVTLGIENHGGITERAERIIQIVKAVDSPYVGINVDTGNFRKDAYNQLRQCLPFAVNSQVKSEIMDETGKKVNADWDRIIRMFAEASYKGYFALEYEAAEPAPIAVPKMTRQLNALAKKYSG
ncbi:MAG: sugar phosphate isomerase/epimerase [Acidobacteria bacterium]|nr:sugar phosphate isomerase/epimerase [Acidobacteriota bacterium]